MKHFTRLFALLVLALATGCVSVVPSGFLAGTPGASSSPASPSTSPALHKLGAPILTWGGDLAGSTMQSQTVSGLTGSAGVVTASAGTLKETGSTLSIADNGSTTRDQFETTHGRITAGGGGTDFSAVIGPDPGFETIASGLWLLPNGTAPTNNNYLLASDGVDSYINSNSGSGVLHFGAAHSYYSIAASNAWYFGASAASAAAPIYFDWSIATTPKIASGTSATSFTLGTNKAGATLTLQSGAAANTMTLDSSGTFGDAKITNGASPAALIGHYNGGNSFDAIWFNTNVSSPTIGNWAFLGSGSDTYLNAPSGNIYLSFAGGVYATWSTTGLTYNRAVTLGATNGANSIAGSLAFATRTVTSAFTVDTTTTDRTIFADTTSAAFTITLPPHVAGRELVFVDSGHSWATHNLTLARNGGTGLINGVSASLIATGSGISGVNEVCRFEDDGVNWQSDCR